MLCTLLAMAIAPLLATPAYAESVRDKQWQLDELRVRSAWKYATGNDIVVAVLDSGVDATHPDLQGRVLPGVDLVDEDGDGRNDTVGHGTTVAALIAGEDDTSGVVGIAPKAKILPVRVLDRKNRYRDASVVAHGVRWAVDHGADVVNMSLGGTRQSVELAEAIQYAYDRDVVVVACSGNVGDENTKIWYPAREPGVVAVTGTDPNGRFWDGSLSGSESVLAAPAARLVGATPGGYWKVQGTSFAAPLVSATAALIRSRWPDMTAPNVVNRLIRTARDKGPEGRDEQYGYGVVDPVSSLANPVTSVRANPLDTTPPSPRRSAEWSSSPAYRTANEDGGTWWWLGLGALGAVPLSTTLALLAAVRHRRNNTSPRH